MENKYKMTKEQCIFLAKRNIVDNIYSSARIEGIKITFPETDAIMNNANVAKLKISEIECILNLRDAWRELIYSIDEEFNLEYICKINGYVARNESLNWGVLRERERSNNGSKL